MSLESVMPSNNLILCHPLLLLPSIFPSIGVFSNESSFHSRWPKYCGPFQNLMDRQLENFSWNFIKNISNFFLPPFLFLRDMTNFIFPEHRSNPVSQLGYNRKSPNLCQLHTKITFWPKCPGNRADIFLQPYYYFQALLLHFG